MTLVKTTKRSKYDEFLPHKQTKKQERLIHVDNRDLWVRFIDRGSDMATSLRQRLGKLVSNIKLKDKPPYREKWPLDGK